MSNAESKADGWGRRPPLHKRQYIVDWLFQYRLIGTLMSIWVANSLFFAVVLYFLFEGHLKQFYALEPRPGMAPLYSFPTLVAVALVFVSVFGFIVLSLIALYMSNQIAGPLYRTKKCLVRVAEGDFGFQLQFRQGDFLRDIPLIVNSMLDSLRQRLATDIEELRAIEATPGDATALKQLVRKQRERKEAQVGLSPQGGDAHGMEREPASLPIH